LDVAAEAERWKLRTPSTRFHYKSGDRLTSVLDHFFRYYIVRGLASPWEQARPADFEVHDFALRSEVGAMK
jgi:hypothetical protein